MTKSRVVEPPSVGELAGGLASDIQDLIRGELSLARAEMDAKIHRLIIALVSVLGGALVGFAGLVVLLEGLVAVLAMHIPAWASLLIVGVVILLVGSLFALLGLKKLSLAGLAPKRSLASLEKDGRIIKEHV